ncbi:cysteine rich repeat-containing protein [Jiella sonneratiae]|uniref:Cysteine rich repeat-containing protein n=1 Tax=Jiella sonneratiae TaxID=2816856 RepID=A0ABS3J8S9_9HYPH|nr:cysteine rich repeat-containing protein [Jiella sonneratiae]MBO0906079.1 hypothetical protein [Jiella sonneratiae]
MLENRVPVLAASTIAAIAILVVATAVPGTARAEASPEMRNEVRRLVSLCRADYDRLCRGVSPGGGRILACLDRNRKQLSPACGQSLERAKAMRDKAAARGALPQ